MFENRVLRIFGTKRDEIIGGWKNLHYEELHNFYSPPNVIRMIKSGRMRWAGHVAQMGRRGMHIGFWWESQKGRHQSDDVHRGGRIILRWSQSHIATDGRSLSKS
jgi:hypothetical protein